MQQHTFGWKEPGSEARRGHSSGCEWCLVLTSMFEYYDICKTLVDALKCRLRLSTPPLQCTSMHCSNGGNILADCEATLLFLAQPCPINKWIGIWMVCGLQDDENVSTKLFSLMDSLVVEG